MFRHNKEGQNSPNNPKRGNHSSGMRFYSGNGAPYQGTRSHFKNQPGNTDNQNCPGAPRKGR